MASASGWLTQLGPRLRAVRGGLHPVSAARIAAGRHDDVRLCGVPLHGPDPRGVANTAVEVAAGEYSARGFAVGEGERVVDAGANVGAFSVLAAAAGASVIAYEPHPGTFAALRSNVAGLDVACVCAAVVGGVPEGGTVSLDTRAGADTQHRIGAEGMPVPAVSLAGAIGEGCDLLKIDCEGAEFEMLSGTPSDALRRARRIACETHAWAGDPASARSALTELGYEVTLTPKEGELALLLARLG